MSSTTQVVMPKMGESVSEGTILQWHKQEGDRVEEDETIVEISTDKVDAEVPAPAGGTVTKVHAEEGATVSVGDLLAEIDGEGQAGGADEPARAQEEEPDDAGKDEPGEDEPDGAGDETREDEARSGEQPQADSHDADHAAPDEQGEGVGADAAESDDAAPDEQAEGASDGGDTTESDGGSGEQVEVVMPQMGESVSEGTILQWHKQEGDRVEEDETIVEISTDKVDAEVPAPAGGTVGDIHAQEGDTVTVGQVLATLTTGGAPKREGAGEQGSPNGDGRDGDRDRSGDGDGKGDGRPRDQPSSSASETDAEEATDRQQAPEPENGRASPVARRVAAAENVDLGDVRGSGPGGRITKEDVLAAARNGGGAAAPADQKAPAGAQPLKGAPAMLAQYMERSLELPTATSFRTITVTTLDGRRKQLKAAGQKVSFTHLIAWAIVRAALDLPTMTHHYTVVDGKPHRVDDGAVHLGLAVDVERRDGSRTLMVPVMRAADQRSFPDFLEAYNDIVKRARDNKLTADDLSGGNISLTNPGGLGTIASVPRLMNDQGTIVATGSIDYPVGLGNVGELIGAEKVMTMTSTYDHRVIQGAESGRFLARIEDHLQGAEGFYDEVFSALGVALGPEPEPPEPQLDRAEAAPTPIPAPLGEEVLEAVQAATSLLKAHRTHGHLAARLDPLGTEPIGDPSLDPEPLGLTPERMVQIPARILRMYVPGKTLADALPHLRETYCGTIAYEIEHISSHRQRVWLREKIEAGEFRASLSDDERKALLRRLIQVDSLERYIHKSYLGAKQFSVEGLDMTVPMLDELIELCARQGAREVVIGMAHRGRLNVLAHNLQRPYRTIFGEFEGASTLKAVTTIPQGGTGDVKYHHGSEGRYDLPEGGAIKVNLESNPSHLEFVSPVVTGATRAAQTNRQSAKATRDTNAAVAVQLHGDAAFPAQGVVAETLNLQALDGYGVGGSVHLIQNNQVGFTTDPEDGRSTRWASDLAKGFDVPIIHVNADDVEACVSAVRLASAFRQEFGHDVLIDLIGYRRYGHNEADEPSYTQPEMYTRIDEHPRAHELYAQKLIADGVVSREEVDEQGEKAWQRLRETHDELKEMIAHDEPVEQQTGEYELDRTPSSEPDTAVDADRLRELDDELLTLPDGFTLHRKLRKPQERRRQAVDDGGPIDWATAESLAFGSLLGEGVPIRLTGQDSERGTFSQRHLVFHDERNGQQVSPIQGLPDARASMELNNSPLSELAAIGFEYGYSAEAPETLVLWEGQFGDFVNGAQVVVDQFIVSGLAKWGQTTRLTLLLPHGYEGQGPEHSSARLERFLQLAAEGNLRVANPTTPAQYFHLLRRQGRVDKQRPLIVMTPKSLLRLSQAMSTLDELSGESRFGPVLAEPGVDDAKVRRLILCTGKIYYDLRGHEAREGAEELAIGRVELLYPFPERQLRALFERYPRLSEVLWVQEEPRNMGARAHMSPRLMQIMPEGWGFGYVGRPERASPGEGYPVAHLAEQERIVTTALDMSVPATMYPKKTPGER